LGTKSQYALIALALSVSPAQAALNTVVTTSPGVEVTVGGIARFQVSNTDMGPFTVKAFFSDSTDQVATWTSGSGDPSNPGKAEASSGARFRLTEFGDTYDKSWKLENLDPNVKLVKLVIDALPGNTVFDLQGPTFSPSGGTVTPGGDDTTAGTDTSEKGYTFKWENPGNFTDSLDPPGYEILQSFDAVVTYSDVVTLAGSSGPVGDLWATLTIDFAGGLANGLVGPPYAGATIPFIFHADTDTIERRALDAPVPEPASCLLFGGLAVAAACRYRRTSAAKSSHS
jgi:hypothetical protein